MKQRTALHLRILDDRLREFLPIRKLDDHWDCDDHKEYHYNLHSRVVRLAEALQEITNRSEKRARLVAKIEEQLMLTDADNSEQNQSILENLTQQIESYDEELEKKLKKNIEEQLRRAEEKATNEAGAIIGAIIERCQDDPQIFQEDGGLRQMAIKILQIEIKSTLSEKNKVLIRDLANIANLKDLAIETCKQSNKTNLGDFIQKPLARNIPPKTFPGLMPLNKSSMSELPSSHDGKIESYVLYDENSGDISKKNLAQLPDYLKEKLTNHLNFFLRNGIQDFVEIMNFVENWNDTGSFEMLSAMTNNYFFLEDDEMFSRALREGFTNILRIFTSEMMNDPYFMERYTDFTDKILTDCFGISISYEEENLDPEGCSLITFDHTQAKPSANLNWRIKGSLEHQTLLRIAQNAGLLGFTHFSDRLENILIENTIENRPSGKPSHGEAEPAEHQSKRLRRE